MQSVNRSMAPTELSMTFATMCPSHSLFIAAPSSSVEIEMRFRSRASTVVGFAEALDLRRFVFLAGAFFFADLRRLGLLPPFGVRFLGSAEDRAIEVTPQQVRLYAKKRAFGAPTCLRVYWLRLPSSMQ